MDKHPKRARDPNELAKSIIDIATEEKPDRDPGHAETSKKPADKIPKPKSEAAR
jgi:hypothetical protein